MSGRTGGKVWGLLLPAGVFVATALFHYSWLALFPEGKQVQSQWLAVNGPTASAWGRYMESRSYYMTYSYALSLAFGAFAFRKYLADRARRSRNLALGGVTLSGLLAVAGCFLLGCCGSPMLGVYLSLFGASFLPFAKPLVALLTTLLVAGSWWWMERRKTPAACEPDCGCGPACGSPRPPPSSLP